MFEQHGFRLLGAAGDRAGAPDAARAARHRACRPSATAPTSRAGLRCCGANSPFDIGQAVVVADNQVLAVEGPGRHRPGAGAGRGAAPQRAHPHAGRRRRPGQGAQDRPGPSHRSAVDRAADRRRRGAGRLAGIAVVAGSTIVAEPERSPPRPTAPTCSSSASTPMARAMTVTRSAPSGRQAGALEIFLVAVEESGDRLGAALMRALRRARRACRCASPASAAAR